MSPSLSVVICSLNGAAGVRRCLDALGRQTIRGEIELIVVDDGSIDGTDAAAQSAGATVFRHAITRGSAAARNTGVRHATAPIIAFLDDDCEPEPDWAENLVAAYDDRLLALGGAIMVGPGHGLTIGFLSRNNPLLPQESNLTDSNNVAYRFFLYLRRQWSAPKAQGRRPVAVLPSANLAVRRQHLLAVSGFDEQIIFGAEDDDLCRRLTDAFPGLPLMFDPAVRVTHHFKPSLPDTLRRGRAYGRGSAIMWRKWPDVPPTIFPFPVLILAVLGFATRYPVMVLAALLLPYVLYPRGLRWAARHRQASSLLDPYLQLAQETADNFGFLEGLWRYRKLVHLAEAPIQAN